MDIKRDAKISSCGRYRYLLSRVWREQDPSISPAMAMWMKPQQMVFVMLNPSTADAYEDDPTIRRCVGFAQRDGFDCVHVANLFAGRATKPDDLFAMEDPAGPRNDHVWENIKDSSAIIVCAWGADRRAQAQANKFIDFMSGRDLYCLGMTKDGHPRHPLYLKKDAPLEPFILAHAA